MFRTRKEKDFEFFVRNLPKLQPIEFVGLCKVLGVQMARTDVLKEMSKEEKENLMQAPKEEIGVVVDAITRPLDEVMEDLMDKFLSLNKIQRRNILQILKDVKRGK